MYCQSLLSLAVALLGASAGFAGPADAPQVRSSSPDTDIIAPDTRTPDARKHVFSKADQALLDEIQHACFLYFWEEVGDPVPLVKDRLKGPVSSIAAVGFQLSSLPIGVERGWITREQGAQRAVKVLRGLLERADNKRFGIYLHFPDLNTGGLSHEGYETVASTVDSALLFAGAIPAAEYFGGETERLTDRMLRNANWRAFVDEDNGFLSMGWKPGDPEKIDGPGEFLDWHWRDAADEERLIYLLAVGAPVKTHAVDAKKYYALQRPVERWGELPPYVVSWPGALFTYFFSHCWIDYGSLGVDNPGAFDVQAPRVDWFENSRRAVVTHRQRCIEQKDRFKSFATNRWGLSACDGPEGYLVPQVQPNRADKDNWGGGTIAPYAAGSAIMFTPELSIAALREYRALKAPSGKPIWRDPRDGGYGLADAFSLDLDYVSDDYIGIDHGPMLLAIENARTGLVWRLFMQNQHVQRGLARLKLAVRRPDKPASTRPTGDSSPSND